MVTVLAFPLLDASTTVLQWGPVADNPNFPGVSALLGLVIAGGGGVAAILGATWLVSSSSDRNGEYPTGDERETAGLSPVTLATVGVVLLIAGLFLLYGG